MGSVYIGLTGYGSRKTGTAYPGGFCKFSDEGKAASKGNLLSFIEPDAVAQYDWFAQNTAVVSYPNTASWVCKSTCAAVFLEKAAG